MSPSSLRETNRNADQWLRDHVVVWWLVLAVVPGAVYAIAELLLNGESAARALVLGAVFGGTFATITVLVQRWRGS